MRPKTLDHVALWVADRDRIADFLTERVGMHVIERTDKFTLMGTNARRGKLTLFDEEGPRERGALKHVAFRVNDLDAALRELDGVDVDRENGSAYFDVHEGLRLGVVQGETDVDYDLAVSVDPADEPSIADAGVGPAAIVPVRPPADGAPWWPIPIGAAVGVAVLGAWVVIARHRQQTTRVAP